MIAIVYYLDHLAQERKAERARKAAERAASVDTSSEGIPHE